MSRAKKPPKRLRLSIQPAPRRGVFTAMAEVRMHAINGTLPAGSVVVPPTQLATAVRDYLHLPPPSVLVLERPS